MIGIIRTQDKTGIHAINSVWVSLNNEIMGETVPSGSDDTGWTLGKFPSIGRWPSPTALAELDRLERWIRDGAKGVYQVSK